MQNISGRYSFLQLLGGSSVGRGFNFAINLLLSRILGPAELGLFALILSTSQTFELLSRAGVDYGLTIALTEQQKDDNYNENHLVIHTALRVVQATSFILLILLLLWLGPANGLLPIDLPENRNLIIIIVSLICISESLSGLPWDILLVKGKINIVRLRQSLFVPLKLGAALVGAWCGGIIASLLCYATMATLQAIWLNQQTRDRRNCCEDKLVHWKQIKKLIGDGLALYISNALSAIVFLPLLADIAYVSGLKDVGYLRAGQIVVQIFTLIPGALAPILFIKSRTSYSNNRKKSIREQSLLMIWLAGIITLIAYIAIDKQLINLLFGNNFLNSLQPTRMLIYITILESVSQILYTPLLANRQVGLFLFVQNGALAISALAGWYFIPRIGLEGFLLAKFIFAGAPLLIYLLEAWNNIQSKGIIFILLATSFAAWPLCWFDSITPSTQNALIVILVILAMLAGLKFKRYLATQSY